MITKRDGALTGYIPCLIVKSRVFPANEKGRETRERCLKRRTTNLCYDRLENRQKRELEPSFEPRENEGLKGSESKQEPRDLMTFLLIRILLRLLLQYRFRESSKKN